MKYMLIKELPGYEVGTCFSKSKIRVNDWSGGLFRELERDSWDITKPLEEHPYVAIDAHSSWLFDLLQREHSNKQWFRALLEHE